MNNRNSDVEYHDFSQEGHKYGIRLVKPITRAEISDVCRKHFSAFNNRSLVYSLYGVIATLIAALASTNTKSILGLSADQVSLFFIFSLISAVVYVSIWIFKNRKSLSIESIRNSIVDDCMNLEIPNIQITGVKAETKITQ